MSTPDSNSAIHAKETSPPEAENTAAQGVAATAVLPSATWWRIADFGMLGLWAAIVLFTIPYHEKWADEGQAWLLARDLPLGTLWFHELRYEGSPGLWHTILWVAQHVFHAPYGAISYIGAAFAAAGVAMLLFATPFPRPIRWLMAFSFFFLYQYAVVARSYVLFALFCFVAVRQYRRADRPAAFAASLIPLALLTAHGSLLAAGLAVSYAWRFLRHWMDHDPGTRKQFVISAGVIALFYVGLFFILLPAPDVEATHGEALTSAVAVHRTLRGLTGALVDNTALSLAVLVIFAGWCFWRRSLLPFALPAALMMALYVYADGWPHQLGTVFLAVVSGLAIAWPSNEEQSDFDEKNTWAYRIMLATLAATLCYQVYAAFYTIYRDVKLPYSGAEDTARFLKPLVAEGKTIDGYQYGMVAINAYFDHNIFANRTRAYYHHSLAEFNRKLVGEQMSTSKSDCAVINWWDQFDQVQFEQGLQAPMAGWGYSLVHVSNGYLFAKTGYSHRQIYFVFCRAQPTDAQTPPPVSLHK